MTREQENQQVYLGYIASIMFALLTATYLSGVIAPPIERVTSLADRASLTAGLFFAACFANPVGLFFRGSALVSFGIGLPLGFVFGLGLDALVIRPFVGEMMSRYVMIFVASAGVPLMMARDAIDARLEKEGTDLAETCARLCLHVLHWPDRFLFVSVMVLVFAMFMAMAETVQLTLAGLGLILSVMTALVAMRSSRDASDTRSEARGFEEWLALLPDPEEEPENRLMQELKEELARFCYSFAPGAAFFGGLMWLATFLVGEIHPIVLQHVGAGLPGFKVTALVAFTGLAIVFFGALVSVALGIGLLHVIGHYARWPQARIRTASYRILRALSFRPMTRSA